MDKKEILGRYINGNYRVTIFSDGTKVRENDLDNLTPAFSENCDVKITDKCSQGCQYCYEGCSYYGPHSDILSQPWINTLHPFTELAINGNDLDHPDLENFLWFLKGKQVIANMTVNQNQLINNYSKILEFIDRKLIWGLGISYKDDMVLHYIKDIPNAVLHVINGIMTEEDFNKISDKGLKILILGYKTKGRGINYAESYKTSLQKNISWLHDNLEDLVPRFKVISFDNLAIEQLKVKRLLNDEEWKVFYMGDDGQYTFYIDAVDGVFARDSMAPRDNRYIIGDKSVDEMFNIIKKDYEKDKNQCIRN